MVGARLPGGFDNVDAECHAVLHELRACYNEAVDAGRDPRRERMLLFSDCAGVVEQAEAAYRAGSARGLRKWQRGAVLEAICDYRARLGSVIIMWVPSHEGVTPGAVADAAAKCSLQRAEEANLTQGVVEVVRSRPCLYERRLKDGAGWELYDRPTFRGARQQSKGWVEARLAAEVRARDEAIAALEKLGTDEVRARIVHAAAGAEVDVIDVPLTVHFLSPRWPHPR